MEAPSKKFSTFDPTGSPQFKKILTSVGSNLNTLWRHPFDPDIVIINKMHNSVFLFDKKARKMKKICSTTSPFIILSSIKLIAADKALIGYYEDPYIALIKFDPDFDGEVDFKKLDKIRLIDPKESDRMKIGCQGIVLCNYHRDFVATVGSASIETLHSIICGKIDKGKRKMRVLRRIDPKIRLETMMSIISAFQIIVSEKMPSKFIFVGITFKAKSSKLVYFFYDYKMGKVLDLGQRRTELGRCFRMVVCEDQESLMVADTHGNLVSVELNFGL